MDKDRRITPGAWARRTHADRAKLEERFGATGIVRCGNSIGTAQLTLRSDIITTAAHVLISTDGRPQGTLCTFEPAIEPAKRVAIDLKSIKTGSRTPLSEPAVRDWAVARLVTPIMGVTPLTLAEASMTPSGVILSAGGNGRPEVMGTEQCSVRRVLKKAADGIREFAIDCSAAPGASGGALVTGHGIIGIYVGYRSATPQQALAYSDTHYNFAITVDGPFRRALLALAGH